MLKIDCEGGAGSREMEEEPTSLQRLIFCVTLTGPRDAETAGKHF